MAKSMNETARTMNYDNLVADAWPPKDVVSVTIRKEASAKATLKRGTVLALSTGTGGDGTCVILGTAAVQNETLTAGYVLCEDTEVGTDANVTALAYRTGHFNRDALIVASEYTLKNTDEEALRNGGILLSDVMEY